MKTVFILQISFLHCIKIMSFSLKLFMFQLTNHLQRVGNVCLNLHNCIQKIKLIISIKEKIVLS